MPPTLNKTTKNLATTYTATAATVTSSAFGLGRALDGVYTMLINIPTVTGTSPTLDIVLQSSPDLGVTYINLPIRSAQITAATNINITFRNGFPSIAGVQNAVTADTGGSLVKDVVFDPDFMKIKATIGGTNPKFTGTVTFLSNPPSGN